MTDYDVRLKLAADRPPVTPRDHQVAAWERLSSHFLEQGKQAGLIVVPTGGGKTVLAVYWALENFVRSGGRVLWLAHRRSLVQQASVCFQRLANVAHPRPTLNLITVSGTAAGWSSVTPEHDVVLSSLQTAVRENTQDFVETFIDDAKGKLLVIMDEAHHAPAPGAARLIRRCKERGAKVLGLTATPIRSDPEDQRRLAALFDESKIYEITRRRLVEQGILASPAYKTVKTRIEVEKEFTQEDYAHLSRFGEVGPDVLARLAVSAPRNKIIVDEYVQNASTYGPTIVFAADTLHCTTLAEEFKNAGVNVDYVTYSKADSQQVIERYSKQKQPDVLINVEMLTEGFDAPHTRTVFIARPTKSESLLVQMVGRALRGKQSGGNDIAHLVTFLDTWEQFDVMDAEYALGAGEDSEGTSVSEALPQTALPMELIREAYRIVRGSIQGHLVGIYECLPDGWYVWEEMFDDDLRRQTVMVFANQAEGYTQLLAERGQADKLPPEISEDFARQMRQDYFGDVPDPLPRWADLQAVLNAVVKGCEVHHYSFEEKREFDPQKLAAEIFEQDMTRTQTAEYLRAKWDGSAACRSVYLEDFRTFLDDVNRHLDDKAAPRAAPAEPEILALVPDSAVAAWPAGEPGYNLVEIRDAVFEYKGHFPNGLPRLGDLTWTRNRPKSYWGFCRYEDRSIQIHRLLNSPDVPLFVMEFLLYHELLHADMPRAGHNADFRARERLFKPSGRAVADAEKRGVPTEGSAKGYWRARADVFLDTFSRSFTHGEPGSGFRF